MQQNLAQKKQADIKIEKITEFKASDLNDICDATESTILEDSQSFNIGLNREEPLIRDRLEKYWKGVLLVPERVLIVGRLDGVIASSIQLIKPSPNNQTSNFSGELEHHFVAPWARGYSLAKELVSTAEKEAKKSKLSLLTLSVREDQGHAIDIYESCGYKRWGTLDKFEKIDGKMYAGHYYSKDI